MEQYHEDAWREKERRDANGKMTDAAAYRIHPGGVMVRFAYPAGRVEHFVPNDLAHTLVNELRLAL